VIKEKRSAHCYLVDVNSSLKHIHAEKLRKYHIAVEEVICDTVYAGHVQTKINHCAVICDEDQDFGELYLVDSMSKTANEGHVELPSQKVDRDPLSHLTK